jgi:hypothetical protein
MQLAIAIYYSGKKRDNARNFDRKHKAAPFTSRSDSFRQTALLIVERYQAQH